VSEQGLMFHLTHNRSFQRRDFTRNRLYWLVLTIKLIKTKRNYKNKQTLTQTSSTKERDANNT